MADDDEGETGGCTPRSPRPTPKRAVRMQQYDVTPEQRRVIEFRTARRQHLRDRFLREVGDPFKQAQGGTVFDPAMLRHQAQRESSFEHFKPNLKTGRYLLGMLVLPYLTFLYLVKSDRKRKEDRYRRGEVAYRDRKFKFA